MKHSTLEQALTGFDRTFQDKTDQILSTIAAASLIEDARVLALRTAETIAALSTETAAFLASTPLADSQRDHHRATAKLARQLRRDVQQFRRDKNLGETILGKPRTPGGSA
jgi:hypothetical protein